MYTMQDRKPLVEPVDIPQSLVDQATKQLELLDAGGTDEQHQAEMVKAWD